MTWDRAEYTNVYVGEKSYRGASRRWRRRALLPALLALLAAAPFADAQQQYAPNTYAPNPYAQNPYAQANPYAQPNPYAQANPYAQPNPYAQAAAPPNPYAPANPYAQAPVRQTQYPYGYYGAPAYSYPGAGYAPRYYGYNNGYGVNYYYVQNPYANNVPYRPAVAGPAPSVTPGWPEPSQPNPPLTAEPEADQVAPESESAGGARPLAIAFHRPTTECMWIDAGYPATFIRPMRMNSPLVTTGSAADQLPGALGQPGTAVLFGGNSADFGLFSGVRMEIGVFLDRENRFSLDVNGLYLLANNQNFYAAGAGNGLPVIARPFFDVLTQFDHQAVFANTGPAGSSTGSFQGAIAIDVKSQFTGGEINARLHQYIQDRFHFDFLGGFRYQRLEESLNIQEQVAPILGSSIPFLGSTYTAPNYLTDQDNFHTLNQFFGPQIGARLTWEERWFTLDGFVKLALGATVEHTDINGSTTLISPGSTSQTANGGILALPSNSGSFNRSVFGILPEFGFDLGINVTPNVRVKLGYSMLLWNRVLRPGGQYDVSLNPNQIPGSPFFGSNTPGPAAPLYRFHDEFFWSNSFNLGLEVHF